MYSTPLITWWRITFSRSALDVAWRRCALTSAPKRLNASLTGMRKVELGVAFSCSAREVEKIPARNVEKSKLGNAVWRTSVGGSRGREMK